MEKIMNSPKIGLIKLGDLAVELGDLVLAVDCYSKVLNRVNASDGSVLRNKNTINELTEKLDQLDVKESNAFPILYADNWKLSKSSFVKGTQCAKYLFLDTFKRDEKTPPSKETLVVFGRGHRFEDTFREKMFPGGINVKDDVGVTSYYKSYTNYLLYQESVSTIYEATVIEDDVLVMCDVLVKGNNGMIDIYECKSSLAINDAIKNDLAIQYSVCKKRFGRKLKSFNLVLATEDGNWTVTDMKSELENQIAGTKKLIAAFKNVISKSEPDIPMGNQCESPYRCEFIEYCTKNIKQ